MNNAHAAGFYKVVVLCFIRIGNEMPCGLQGLWTITHGFDV